MRISKIDRQHQIKKSFQDEPFITDEEMAKRCQVSIQTIRLDRLELGIPEMRERIKHMAEGKLDQIRTLSPEEVIGEVIDLQWDRGGISLLEVREEHVFTKTKIARGHYLFAQANSLAVALVNAEVALTRTANIRFVRSVHLGERCVARAQVVEQKSTSRLQIQVKTKVGSELVFHGTFDVYRPDEHERMGE